MKETCPFILIPFPPTVWEALFVRAVRVADIPDMRFPKVLNTASRISRYFIMPADSTACTVRTIISKQRHFPRKGFPQNNYPVPWTKRPIVFAISAEILRPRFSMPSRHPKRHLHMRAVAFCGYAGRPTVRLESLFCP